MSRGVEIPNLGGTQSVLSLPAIVFDVPARLPPVPNWNGLIPVAFWLVDALRPEILVELGTHMGNSYLAFCQAVARLGLTTRCFAVDNWKGDQHAGFYDEGIYEELKAYHDPLYGNFSRLLRSSFDDAVGQFGDGTIDLLHIDGAHSYSSVRHDFEAWLPKLSARSVVLFHDICERERDFGVWRLWEEISRAYPSFAFLHSHGLGILAVGKNRAGAIQWLTEEVCRSPTLTAEMRAVFSRLGDAVQAWQRVLEENARNTALELTIERLEEQRRELMEDAAQAAARAARRQRELQALRESTSWRITGPARLAKRATTEVAASTWKLVGPLRRALAPSRQTAQRSDAGEPARYAAAPLGVERTQTVRMIRTPAEVAVILHLHYADLLEEMAIYLRNIPEPYHLYVSVTDQGSFDDVVREVLSHHLESEVRLVANRGRDILPMLESLSKIIGSYSYVAKIHTKKSLHSLVGKQWRKELLNQLLGDRDKVEAILACFRAYPDLGLIGPDGHRLTDAPWWRQERARVMDLARRMEVAEEHLGLDFFAGSMFWFRPAALKPLADLGLTASNFEIEAGKVDGTMANVVERCFSMSAKAAGYRVTDSAAAIVAARALEVSGRGAAT